METSPVPDALHATVYVIEQMGREILLTAMLGTEAVRAFTSADATLDAVQEVWLTFREGAVHLFDGQTEQALDLEVPNA